MIRRSFITALGGAAVMPFAARAQQTGKMPTIGFLGANTPAAQSQWNAAFVQRLRELGWVEGRTVAIEYRWAEGQAERNSAFAAEFIRLAADVIVTHANQATTAVKQTTSLIPIVFAAVGDPVGVGLVASLARPGGNVTGLSLQQTDTVGKRLELLREVVPGRLRRLAVLTNVGNPGSAGNVVELQAAAHRLSLEIIWSEIRSADDIAPAFDALKGQADGLYVSGDPLALTNVIRINTLATAAQLPTVHIGKEYVQAGGLMSYGPNYPDLYRRTAEMVDKILRGAKPIDIPVEQPTRFDLVINLTTAKALGLTVPPTLLARADEVIE